MARLDLQRTPSRPHARTSRRKYVRGYAVTPHAIWGDEMSSVTSLTPATAAVGAGGTITVNGTGFTASSVVIFDGDARPTTYVSPTQITATLATLVAPARVVFVNVSTGGGSMFVITGAMEDAPTSTWLKADILTWLGEHGVDVSASATQALTKAELLEIVALVLNGDTDPLGSFEAARTTP